MMTWKIFCWSGRCLESHGRFASFEDAEQHLSVFLGDAYETDRQEYDIRKA